MSIFQNTIKEFILSIWRSTITVDIDNTEYTFPIREFKYIKLRKADKEVWQIEIAFADQKVEVFVQEWQDEDNYDEDADVWVNVHNFREALAVEADITCEFVMCLRRYGYHHEISTLKEFRKLRGDSVEQATE